MRISLLFPVLASLMGLCQAAPTYTMTALPGDWMYRLNDLGQTVGVSGSQAAIYSSATGILSVLPLPSFASFAAGLGINNAGQIAGAYNSSSGQGGFFWSGGVYTQVPQLLSIDRIDVNSQGLTIANGTLFNPSTGITSQTGNSSSSINNSGVATGWITPDGNAMAANWQAGVITQLGRYPGDASSYAIDINNNGVVVGYGAAGGVTFGQTYDNGSITRLPLLGGLFAAGLVSPRGINDSGQIVGYASYKPAGLPQPSVERAYLFDSGQALDVNNLVLGGTGGNVLQRALDINNRGQILVQSTNNKFFLLTPTSTSPVPEPSSIMLTLAGVLVILRTRTKA